MFLKKKAYPHIEILKDKQDVKRSSSFCPITQWIILVPPGMEAPCFGGTIAFVVTMSVSPD